MPTSIIAYDNGIKTKAMTLLALAPASYSLKGNKGHSLARISRDIV